MLVLHVIASVFILLTLTGTIVALSTNEWFTSNDLSMGLFKVCKPSGCVIVIGTLPGPAQATFGLIITSASCSLLGFLAFFCGEMRKKMTMIGHLFVVLATLTLLVGCCLWTGFFVAGNLQDVQKEINSKKFPFGYSYVIAWVSWFLSVISFALIYCYRRGLYTSSSSSQPVESEDDILHNDHVLQTIIIDERALDFSQTQKNSSAKQGKFQNQGMLYTIQV